MAFQTVKPRGAYMDQCSGPVSGIVARMDLSDLPDSSSLRGHIMDLIKHSSLLVFVVLSACASTGTSNTGVVPTGLPMSDNFRVERSPSPEYDYLVTIKNGKDLGIDADNQLARDRMALLALKDQCEAPQIVKEVAVNSGSDLFGSTARTYQLHVKC